ncbi:MAG: 4-hydroxy-tetrahydrodipicolinate reductase, partial [Smithellaceae bacterium]
MTKVVVTGAAGKMGNRIISLISAMADVKLVGAVETTGHPLIGSDVGQVAGLGKTGVLISDNLVDCLSQADVVIDFTNHEASLTH